MKQNIDVVLENHSLKSMFKSMGLDLAVVFDEIPDDLERENVMLQYLLSWVNVYQECKNRKEMEVKGFIFPPISSGLDFENDWYRFECWIENKKLTFTIRERLLDFNYITKNVEELSYDDLIHELNLLYELLKFSNIVVDNTNDVPPQLVYQYILSSFDDEFDVIVDGYWHLDGCSGFCPGCFQRPWCELGICSCWREDEEQGDMVIEKLARKFVSPSPISLELLQKSQAQKE